MGSIIGVVGFGLGTSSFDVVRDASAAQSPTVEPVVSYPTRELSGDWKWNPKPGNYDAMYRGVQPQRLGWIRNRGAR
jgi:hypothetical protein